MKADLTFSFLRVEERCEQLELLPSPRRVEPRRSGRRRKRGGASASKKPIHPFWRGCKYED